MPSIDKPSLDDASDLVNPAAGYNAPPAPTLHEEMLAALRAAEQYIATDPQPATVSRQVVLRQLQAVLMKAERQP